MQQGRTLSQIIAELNPTYQAQTNAVQQQIGLIPQQIQAQEQGLNAQKDSAYEDIVNGARRRGLGFSGIPLGEQAKYAATNYAPALANLRSQGQNQALTLQQALLGINERRDTLANQIYQTEQDRAFQANEAEKNRKAQLAATKASAASKFSPTYGNTTNPAAKTARVVQSKPGSFAFYDANDTPITAAQYAQQSGISLGDVLFEMGQAGDKSAQSIYNLLQTEARNDDGGKGYANALSQLQKRVPHLLGGV